MPELVNIYGQWHIIHQGKTLRHHAEKERALADLKVFRAKFSKAQGVKPAKQKPAKQKPAKPEPTLDLDDYADEPTALDLSILDGSVRALIDALATGELDEHLDALLEAEREGKGRKSAIRVIQARKS